MILSDVKVILRGMLKRPFYSATVVLTLALGIGANTAVFTLVNAVLLRPFPFPESERLVAVKTVSTVGSGAVWEVSLHDVDDLRERVSAVASIGTYRAERINLVPDGRAIPVRVAHVTPPFFDVLETPPLLGRTFLPDEDQPGGDIHKAVLSFNAWQSLYGGSRDLVGTTIRTSMGSYDVVGIMPSGFTFPGRTDLWIPVQSFFEIRETDRTDPELRGYRFVHASIARLAAGTELDQARAELEAVSRTLQGEYPDTNRDYLHQMLTLREAETGSLEPYLLLLLGAVGLVLLICCANVSSLLLSRAVSRSKELALRVALGAGRIRLARELLTESLVFAVLGAALGLVLATATVRLFYSWTSVPLPVWAQLEIDAVVLAVSVGLAILTGIFVGLASLAFVVRSGDMARAVREGARETFHGGVLRPALVVGQVTLCLVLLVGAALLLSSLDRLRQVDEGLDTESVLTVTLSAFRPGDPETRIRNVTAYYRRVIERLKELPGVVAVGGTDKFPYGPAATERRDYRVELRGDSEEDRAHRGPTIAVDVTPEYFQAVGVPLLEGRTFNEDDTLDAPRVIILSASAAERLFPGRSAVGQDARITVEGGAGDPWARVVGVVGDVKFTKREDDSGIELYYPYTQYGLRWTTLAVRTRGPTTGLDAMVREAVHSVDPETAVEDIKTFSTLVDDSLWREKLWGTLLASFAALALALAAIGLYGVVAYAVTSRTREIGVRMALGSRPTDVLALITKSGMSLVGIGLALGLTTAALLVPLIRSVLFEPDQLDYLAFGMPTLVLAAVSLAACIQPAIRAARIDPLKALRQD